MGEGKLPEQLAVTVDEYASEVVLGTEITAPASKVISTITGKEYSDVAVTVSAKFNGETVDITNGFTSDVTGTLEITYSAEGCEDVTITIAVIAADDTLANDNDGKDVENWIV